MRPIKPEVNKTFLIQNRLRDKGGVCSEVGLGNQEEGSGRESFQKSGQAFRLGQAIGRVPGVTGS